MSQTYDAVNKAWKDTCRVLLGEEIGSLDRYEDYLQRFLEPVRTMRSAASGKDVNVSSRFMHDGARFIGLDEIGKNGAGNATLNIDQIKDIDSIISAIQENFIYCGNKITGNSSNVEGSDSCSNSHFIYKSAEIYDSKYVGYSCLFRYCESLFGCNWGGESKFIVKGYELYRSQRCMEVMRIANSSDCYYSAAIEGCTNAMFSFNQVNKRHVIGNLQLEADIYKKLKAKLLEEIRGDLEARKRTTTLVGVINGDADG
ncbi:MAG: hypothetical protein ACP5NX_00360 [Candidatus Bilamarchaeaceae archaeon]